MCARARDVGAASAAGRARGRHLTRCPISSAANCGAGRGSRSSSCLLPVRSRRVALSERPHRAASLARDCGRALQRGVGSRCRHDSTDTRCGRRARTRSPHDGGSLERGGRRKSALSRREDHRGAGARGDPPPPGSRTWLGAMRGVVQAPGDSCGGRGPASCRAVGSTRIPARPSSDSAVDGRGGSRLFNHCAGPVVEPVAPVIARKFVAKPPRLGDAAGAVAMPHARHACETRYAPKCEARFARPGSSTLGSPHI